MARLHRALIALKLSRRHLPQSLLGQAIDYTLSQWATLRIYLEDGRLEIDNNLVENAIRPTAVGKKNWLSIGEAEAGQREAILIRSSKAVAAAGSIRTPTCASAHPPAP